MVRLSNRLFAVFLLLGLSWCVLADTPPVDRERLYADMATRRVHAGNAALDVWMTQHSGEPVKLLLSFPSSMSIAEAVAHASKFNATIMGFGHQVADNFGAYPIPEGVSLQDGIATYRKEYAAFNAMLSSQLGAFAASGRDDGIKASAARQRAALDARSDASQEPPITGLYVRIAYSDLPALRVEQGKSILAIEPWLANRTALPIPVYKELK